MMIEDAIEIKKPEPDSQYRLRNCKKCRGDDVAYVKYQAPEGERWRVACFSCGHTLDRGDAVKHDAQVAWNEVA